MRAEPPHFTRSSEAPTTATDLGAHTARRSGRKPPGAGAAAADAPLERTTSASAATGRSPAMMSGLTSISAILRVVLGDAGDGQHDVDQPAAVDGRLAAKGPQELLRADEIEELVDIALADREDRERDVAEHLGHDAAQTEGHHRPEGGVALSCPP